MGPYRILKSNLLDPIHSRHCVQSSRDYVLDIAGKRPAITLTWSNPTMGMRSVCRLKLADSALHMPSELPSALQPELLRYQVA